MREEPLQFGDDRRLFGILTLAGESENNMLNPPVFVFLNAGALPRAGPHRLHVRLARELASMGISSLRVDLSGRGDSLPRSEPTYQESIAAGFESILGVLESQLGSVSVVLVGLCSGADDAIKLTATSTDRRVVGMVLLDPVCDKDDGFRARALVRKLSMPSKYLPWLMRRIGAVTQSSSDTEDQVDSMLLRDPPSLEQTRSAFESIRERDGRVLSVFTQYALQYYNQIGQMDRVLNVDGYEQFCTELFWPHVEHTYPFDLHRRRLIEEIKTWAVK